MELRGLWDDERERAARSSIRAEVLTAFRDAEVVKRPPLREMFTDVYEEMTEDCKRDRSEMKRLLETYPLEYDVDEFEGGKDGL